MSESGSLRAVVVVTVVVVAAAGRMRQVRAGRVTQACCGGPGGAVNQRVRRLGE